jgi:tetratricopeptide (TPR) repeat protein
VGVILEQGRYEEAEALLLDLVETMPPVLGERHLETQAALYNLGCVYARQGRRREALDRLDQALERGFDYGGSILRDPHLVTLHGDPEFEAVARKAWLNRPDTWRAHRIRAATAAATGRPDDALSLLAEVLEAMKRKGMPQDDPDLSIARYDLMEAYVQQGRYDEAEALAREELETLETAPEQEPGQKAATLWTLAECQLGRGDTGGARALVERAREIYGSRLPEHFTDRTYIEAARAALDGDRDRALHYLRLTADRGYAGADEIAGDLLFSSLWDEPEFQAILGEMRARYRVE